MGNNEGIYTIIPSPSGRYVIDRYSASGTPRDIAVIDTYTGKEHILLTAADPYQGHEMPEIVTGTIRAADGETDLYYRMVKTAGFRSFPEVSGRGICIWRPTCPGGEQRMDAWCAGMGYLYGPERIPGV
ncbi:MAG: hypothetical protein LUD15_12210 [Bacteroides sp.]|nr:hypothetical protein [Bacteroides sp.]